MGLMINKNFNDKWIQKFINLLQGFFYAQYCPFGQEDERKIEQEICNLLMLQFLPGIHLMKVLQT